MKDLYKDHIKQLMTTTLEVMEACDLPGLVLDAGELQIYYADDSHIPFRPTPHFAHWCPISGSGHFLVIDGKQASPRLLRFRPEDFWYDQFPQESDFWCDALTIDEYSTPEAIFAELKVYAGYGYVGPRLDVAKQLSLVTNCDQLIPRLDWQRGPKSAYEIACLRQASIKAARGHIAARQAFIEGKSEREIQFLYLLAVDEGESDLPYETIIGLNEKAATLHYHGKRRNRDGATLLIDAGASSEGYGSDITRTYARKNAVHPVFIDLLASMEAMQQSLAQKVRVDCDFSRLHDESCLEITKILLDHDILQGVTIEQAVEQKLVSSFFPHGLGHMLGIQVHDVGGRQIDAVGTAVAAHHKDPRLRTTRKLRDHEVVTIEPGLYFIPILLKREREGENAKHFNWSLIDALCPFGGMRIEDDLVVQGSGSENLTRAHLGNEFVI